jgi:oxygen-independent coproporphyrinogen III oxidase
VSGLYVHIPFCVRKCTYCDFYSLPQRLELIPAFLDAVLAEAQACRGRKFETLFLGGGTPSLLGPSGISILLDGLRRSFDIAGLIEATLEANPESVTPELLQAARGAGLNRISIGVQSLSDAELQSVGRIHSASQAVSAVGAAWNNGFSNISADVILGLPGQDWSSLMVTLETLIGLEVQHLSVYCLAIEPHTPLAAIIPADLPSEDTQAELFENVCVLLAKRGFVHYEISNFALPGFECRHNLNYWRGGDYLGLGPAAASHINNRRYKNKADLEAYLQNPCGQTGESEELPAAEKAAEEAVLRLRLLNEGLKVGALAEKYGDEHLLELVSRLDRLVKEGCLLRAGGTYSLEPSLALVSNVIFARVL